VDRGAVERFAEGVETTSTVLVRPARGQDLAEREAWYRVKASAKSRDFPPGMPSTRELTLGPFDHPLPGGLNVRFVAEDAGDVVGILDVDLPMADNTDNALVDVVVHPGRRRRGIGTELWAQAREVAREHERTRIITTFGQALGDADGGAGFLEGLGLTRALQEAIGVLDLDAVPDGEFSRMHDAAERRASADGYALELWTGAPTPEAQADIGALERTLSIDAPLGELAWEPEVWDADRVAGFWAAVHAVGLRSYHAAARRRDGGPLVGWTTLVTAPSMPDWAMQWNTVVAPDHRGHRLGMWLKTENLAAMRVAEPLVRRIETENAVDNGPMLDVNAAMGFRVVGHVWEWQRELA
jgi:GNAT superfamily N-acetyltransferase